MLRLLKLEARRMRVGRFLRMGAILSVFLLALGLLVALTSDDLARSYTGFIHFNTSVHAVAFGIFAAVMLARTVVEEYHGKTAILLFAYPIPRKQLFFAKLLLVGIFVILAQLLFNFLGLLVFFVVNQFKPVAPDVLDFGKILYLVVCALAGSVVSIGIGYCSLFVGYLKKSVPTTIVTSVIVMMLLSNLVTSSMEESPLKVLVLGGALVLASAVLNAWVANQIQVKEI